MKTKNLVQNEVYLYFAPDYKTAQYVEFLGYWENNDVCIFCLKNNDMRLTKQQVRTCIFDASNEISELCEDVLNVARNNPNGFTYNLLTEAKETSGYSVAYAATQNNSNDFKKAVKHALLHRGIVGGWIDSETNTIYIDSVKILHDKNMAIEVGKHEKQIAIFCLDEMTEIRL